MSVTKTMPALVIDLLISDGKIDENRTIGFYVPEFRGSAWENIKVRDVVDMTPGIDVEENDESRANPDSTVSRVFRAEFGMPYKGKQEILLDVLKDAKKKDEPGTKFEYGSPTTQMLVYLAEAATGKRWAQFVDKRIWSKLGAEGPLLMNTTPDGVALAHGPATSRLRVLARYGMLFTPSWNKVASGRVGTPQIIKRIRQSVRSKKFYRDEFDGPVFISRLNDDSMISNSRQWDAVWPDGDFWKAGIMSQGLYVSPDKDLVIAFYIGSATKPFTSTVALKMADRGELDLNAPVRKYLPDFQVNDIEASEKAKLIDLFQHKTGWRGDYFDDLSSGEDGLQRAVQALRFLPQRTPFGEVWAYNNVNSIIAGRIIQVVSRAKSYEQLVKEELLLPLGMAHTSFFMAELMADGFAVGHGPVFDGKSDPKVSFAPFPRGLNPMGGLLSNVSDMMKWVPFQLDGKDKDGKQLLSPKLLEMSHSPLVRGELDEYTGIAWFVEDIGGSRVVFHASRVVGFTAKVLFVPEMKYGIVVLTNGDRGIEVYDAVVALALEKYLGIEKKPLTAVAASRDSLEPFSGTWIGDVEDYKFYFEGEQLKAQRLFKPVAVGAPKPSENPPPITIGSAGKDMCIMTDGPYKGTVGELSRDTAGKVKLLRMQHRIFRRGE